MTKYHVTKSQILSTTVALGAILAFSGCDWCGCCKVQKEKVTTQAKAPVEDKAATPAQHIEPKATVEHPMPEVVHPVEQHPMPMPEHTMIEHPMPEHHMPMPAHHMPEPVHPMPTPVHPMPAHHMPEPVHPMPVHHMPEPIHPMPVHPMPIPKHIEPKAAVPAMPEPKAIPMAIPKAPEPKMLPKAPEAKGNDLDSLLSSLNAKA